MAGSVQILKTQYLRAHKRFKRWKTVVIALSSVIALGTSYVLINPAQGQEQTAYCGFEEHVEHTEKCYGKQLICGLSEDGHTHSDSCYEEQEVYTCGKEETEGHTHTDSCYGSVKQLICGKEETSGHAHTAECYKQVSELTCGKVETEGHTHTDDCYGQKQTLICTNTDPDHAHTEDCYITEQVLTCSLPECEAHNHTDACYTVHDELVCTLQECEAHTHSDGCYEETTGPVCGLEECEPHTHDASCVTMQKVLVCDLEESASTHTHTDECYGADTVLICDKPIHEHTLQCFSNPDADLESEAVWNQIVSGVVLTGNWADDFVAIAKTQLGYTESSTNYLVAEDGVNINGYSRYGAWYGMPYGDWCAMFCSFCLHYAGIDSEFFPYDMTCDTWINALCGRTLSNGTSMFRASPYYAGNSNAASTNTYQPVRGDLVFFDTSGNGVADHVGIVYEVSEDGLTIATIEGNLCDTVGCASYSVTAPVIVGYGVLPENPCPCKNCYDKYGNRLCGEDCECSCHIEAEDNEENSEETEELETSSISEEINGVTVTVTGQLPEGALLLLSEVPEEQLQEILAQAGGDTSVFAYDITIVDDEGNTWQPDELGAAVSITGLAVSGEENLQVVHVPDEGEIEEVESETTEGAVEFTAESFSIYVGYTVDFHYDDLTFSIPGESSIYLSEIFTQLGIPDSVADVVSVTFSDPELLTVEQTQTENESDWLLTSQKSFVTEETLTVVFTDEKTLVIKVTDPTSNTSNSTTGVTIPTLVERDIDHYKFIDSFSDKVDNAETDLDDRARSETVSDSINDLYRLYLDIGPETSYIDMDVLFIIDTSNSMSSSDATDINGTGSCKRSWALDTLLNGESATSTNAHQTTLYANGLISKIIALNPNNRIAIGSFAATGSQLINWTGTASAVTYTNSTGTNYVAGLQEAVKLIDSSDSSKKKIMIFISDGDPTCYYDSLTTTTGSTQVKSNDATTLSKTASAITEFKDKYSTQITNGNLTVYTVGVGSFNTTYLSQLATSGSAISSTNFQDLLTMLDATITGNIGHYSHITVTDTLSDYVDFYKDDLDFLVQKIYGNTAVTLYENGSLTTEGKNYIQTNGVSIDYTNKTVTVKFLDSYELVANTTFRISFNVKSTQTAYDTYNQNLEDSTKTDGYAGTVGDTNTDYSTNTTSSGKSGFYSNSTATVTYTQAFTGKSGTAKTLDYSKPVIQVSTTQDITYEYQLPETGGGGTALYRFTGAAIIVTTAILYYNTQKKKREYHYENL